jgi:hypothetical protein
MDDRVATTRHGSNIALLSGLFFVEVSRRRDFVSLSLSLSLSFSLTIRHVRTITRVSTSRGIFRRSLSFRY